MHTKVLGAESAFRGLCFLVVGWCMAICTRHVRLCISLHKLFCTIRVVECLVRQPCNVLFCWLVSGWLALKSVSQCMELELLSGSSLKLLAVLGVCRPWVQNTYTVTACTERWGTCACRGGLCAQFRVTKHLCLS
jgi:hypothetical protein